MPSIPNIPNIGPAPSTHAASKPRDSGALVELARQHAAAFAPTRATFDRENRFPREHFEALKASGYTGATVPQDCGGMGVDPATLAEAQMLLAEGDGPLAVALTMHLFNVAIRSDFYRLGDTRQKGFLEAVAGKPWIVGASTSDPMTHTGYSASGTNDTVRTAEAVDGGYRVNGRSTFGSLCEVADYFGSSALFNDPARGERILNFQVPMDSKGVEVQHNYDTMSIRSSASHDVVWNDVFVPTEACVDRPVRTWDRFNNIFYAWFSPTISACYLGIAKAARDFAVERVGHITQKPFPVDGRHVASQQMLAGQMQQDYLVALAMLRQTAAGMPEAKDRAEPQIQELMACQRFITETAIRIVDTAMRLCGGASIQRKLPLEQHYRDVRAAIIHPPWSGLDGASMLGKLVFGLPLDKFEDWH